jgi:flagellum-specific peptidoglycan hydrolase FlgJ
MTTPEPEIVEAAQAAQRKWKIPASVSLSQWALESGWGKHTPPGSNNPFGYKALPGQPSVTVQTREFVHGRYITINAPFRKFDSLADAFDEHARLLAQAAPYAKAREVLPSPINFVHALTGIYATDPAYGSELTTIIIGDKLTQYDVTA